jgi:hypothetical protein
MQARTTGRRCGRRSPYAALDPARRRAGGRGRDDRADVPCGGPSTLCAGRGRPGCCSWAPPGSWPGPSADARAGARRGHSRPVPELLAGGLRAAGGPAGRGPCSCSRPTGSGRRGSGATTSCGARLRRAGVPGPGAREAADLRPLDEWVPRPRLLSRSDALAELGRRVLPEPRPRDRGRLRDLGGADVGRREGGAGGGFAAPGPGERRRRRALDAGRRPARDASGGHLLPGFDELLLGYKDRTAVLARSTRRRSSRAATASSSRSSSWARASSHLEAPGDEGVGAHRAAPLRAVEPRWTTRWTAGWTTTSAPRCAGTPSSSTRRSTRVGVKRS